MQQQEKDISSQNHHSGSWPGRNQCYRNETGSGLKAGGLQLRQSTFNWSTKNKYDGLKNWNGCTNSLMTKNYDTADAEKVSIVKN